MICNYGVTLWALGSRDTVWDERSDWRESLDGAKVSETADSRVYFVITLGGEEGVSGGVVCGVVGECEIRTKHGRAQCSII